MLNLIIGILVIIVVIYISIVIYQKGILKKAMVMQNQINKFEELNLDDDFNKVKKLGLIGESKKMTDEAFGNYQDLLNQSIPQARQLISTIEKGVKGVNFINTRNSVEQLQSDSVEIATKLDEIQDVLDKVKQLAAEHQKAVSSLEFRYRKLRKVLLTKNGEFGPAIDALEEQLSAIEETFDVFSNLTKQGDQSKAEKVLVDLNTSTEELEKIINEIPKLYKLNSKQFVNQIDEISNAYSKMKKEGYNFIDDEFEISLKELQNSVNDNLEGIKKLEIPVVDTEDEIINTKINRLYDEMEVELKARVAVEKDIEKITMFVEHATHQNTILREELERLSHNYSLEHGEIKQAQDFEQQIAEISEQHQADLKTISDGKVIYSEIDSHNQNFNSYLTLIEKQQMELNDSISDFSKEEKIAHRDLSNLSSEMHMLQRKVENLNLPGIANDYVEFFDMVAKEINQLSSTMNRVKISMDDVQKQLSQIKQDRDALQEKTDDLIDQSILAEQVMQYANRYAKTKPEIGKALLEAKDLFDKQYQYNDSLAVIANAIDRVEPGTYKKIEDRYYKNKAK
ncbi:septation ring formation regulator EzrA [Fructilactobacillus vespulae]|uniref:septation ring formation regulator EzrA n=1 Tax=Fructilactobacillus vespulae TaxID=1249630 RepID=UPI0039B6D8B3